jgi:uncharacterized membrane protein (UPF0127 family)
VSKRCWPGARSSTENPSNECAGRQKSPRFFVPLHSKPRSPAWYFQPIMKHALVHNLSCPEQPPVVAVYCASFFCQLRGLTFRRSLAPEAGLLLVQKRDSRLDAAIHMLGVFMDLAVAWINAAGEVVDVCLARRWRPFYVPRRPARYVLEMPPGRLGDFHIGDRVHIEQFQPD